MKPWSFCLLWIHRPQLSCALLFLTPLPLPHIGWMTLIPGSRRKQRSSKRWPMTTPRNITPTTAASRCCYSDCMDQCHARGLDPKPSLLPPTGSFPVGPVCPLPSGTPRWKNTLWNLTEVVLDLTPWTAACDAWPLNWYSLRRTMNSREGWVKSVDDRFKEGSYHPSSQQSLNLWEGGCLH